MEGGSPPWQDAAPLLPWAWQCQLPADGASSAFVELWHASTAWNGTLPQPPTAGLHHD